LASLQDIGLLKSARALAVDGWTGEAVDALERAGVPSLLLKGPAISRWLYDHGEERGYIDADLLVPPDARPAAEAELARLGYELRDPEGERELYISGPHAQTWIRRSDEATIDLHHLLPGLLGGSDIAWPVLWERASAMSVGGVDVPVLDVPARALMVAIHAAHHGPEIATPIEDLRRAFERMPLRVWFEAAELAELIMALPQFAEGLELTPQGVEVARRIHLPASARLLELRDDPILYGMERLAAARGFRERATLIRRKAFPSRVFMHWWAPWTRRSILLLQLGYVYRLGWLALWTGPGWRTWRRTRQTDTR
jgi:hypothetical protein